MSLVCGATEKAKKKERRHEKTKRKYRVLVQIM